MASAVTALGAEDFFELAYGDGTRFVVDRIGERLWGTWSPPLTLDDLAVYLRGPALGFVLRRRGLTPLHASAVSIGTHAAIVCGASQAGKSTIAAALALLGTPVLCDDIAALREDDGGFQVEPGYPRVCLWPDAVQSLQVAPYVLPRLTPSWEKRFLALDGNSAKFESQSRPLAAIYLLANRTTGADVPRIEEISPREALLGLVQNTYMNWLPDRGQRVSEFEALSKLVSRVPVRRIVPHVDCARIRDLCDLIVEDALLLSTTQAPADAVLRR